ncbi:MAG: insulinase family protein, partial [Acidobacteriota bacterium]
VILGAGAGLSGRLPERVREREGLAYAVDVSAVAGCGLEAGRLAVYVGVMPDRVDQAETAVREELERLVTDGVTDAEVADARAYLIGREPFRRETLKQRAERIAESEVYGLPDDRPGIVAERLAAVDRSTVEAAVRRWIRPDALRVTIGRPG